MAAQASKAQQVAEKRRKLKAQYAGGNGNESGAQVEAEDAGSHDADDKSGSGQLGDQQLPDIASGEDDKSRRVLFINDPKTTNERYEYAGNIVRTSKYTFLSFLPRNLFEQFHRVAYLYFLVIVILNQFPQLAVFGRTASIFPLAFVLIVTAIKDGYEDFGRHRSDRRENNRLASAFSDGEFGFKKWKTIRVGEVLKIYEKETVPCDVVLLGTSDPSGVAYIETLNLDGESNLKSRYARQETVSKMQNLASLAGSLTFEAPNRNIYEFTAYMDLDGVQLPLGPNNIVLRGCEVKNTSWIIGVVVYAGQETKAMLNSSGAQSKRSRLEKQMNREIAWLAVFLIAISLVGGIGMGVWVKNQNDELNVIPYYVKTNPSTQKSYHFYGQVGEAIFGFLGCIITFQVMVPISLYISMELVRLGQSYFMTEDMDMYDPQTDSPFQARALNINEDLGQIKYLFSDKTGTLTENKMEFQTASISGVDYAKATLLSESAVLDEGSREQSDISPGSDSKRTWRPKLGAKLDRRLVNLLLSQADTVERRAAHDFMLALTACNTVVPDSTVEQVEGAAAGDVTGAMKYQAESPDEHALVSAAAQYGYVLFERSSEHLLISVLGTMQRFDVLGVHEFDSVRKRMSVVLKCPDGTVKVFVKGADTEVLELIAVQSVSNQGMSNDSASKYRAEVMLSTLSHLDGYAREGLRTLVVAVRQLDQDELTTWQLAHSKASISLRDRVGMMRSAAELVERNLTLLGATGIEDKLQDGVPETIASLREAGIKVWVLTGDKQETAISIAFSCLLLTREMEQIIINESTKEGCHDALLQARIRYNAGQQEVSKAKRKHRSAATGNAAGTPNATDDVLDVNEPEHHRTRESTMMPLALIIDGNSLVHALAEELEQELVELALLCTVVVCCRVAPLQKAGLVSLVKRTTNELTLAVGDGANDVSMIQMADVGVGITGQEGRQAVMASDFAIGQFRFLKKLLLVHGHWNYHRLGYMVLYNFYRNAVFVMLLFWYILYTAFSPSSALTDWNLVFYSLIYTSVPTIVAGILDKDITKETLMAYPPLYGPGQRGEAYNRVLFWATMLDTLWQSLVLFYVAFFTFKSSLVEIWSLGDLWTVGVVVLVTVQLAIHVRTWTWIHHVALWGSVLATFICLFVMDSWTLETLLYHYWSIFHIISTAAFWLDILLMLVLALLPYFFILVMQQRFWPSDIDIARELESKGRTVDRASVVELNEVPHLDRGQTDA